MNNIIEPTTIPEPVTEEQIINNFFTPSPTDTPTKKEETKENLTSKSLYDFINNSSETDGTFYDDFYE